MEHYLNTEHRIVVDVHVRVADDVWEEVERSVLMSSSDVIYHTIAEVFLMELKNPVDRLIHGMRQGLIDDL